MGIFTLFSRNNIKKEIASDLQYDKIKDRVNVIDSSPEKIVENTKMEMSYNSLRELNEEQREAVSFDGKHLLVLAGAGTGKTKTIIARALHLLESGVNPSKILILSFTRKSANEIVSRIAALNTKSIGISGQTFHSWCMNIIKSNPNIFNREEFTCLDEDDRESAIKLLCGKKFKDKDDKRISPSKIIDVYSYAKNAKCSLSESIRVKIYDNGNTEGLRDKIAKNKSVYEDVIKKYILYKNDHNYIDYDDILGIVSSVLKNNPKAAQFISQKYEHILVDEMQDTNPLQYELLSSFYNNCHLFCVGDDAQSIYGFRGADFKTIHNFTSIVEESRKTKLSLNYRSTQEILDVSNWLLSQSTIKYDKKLNSFRGNGEKPVLIHVDNNWEEANHITNDILKNINEKGYEYKDHLVLSRTNSGLKIVESHCLSKKIPYQIFGGTQLMQSKHVRDIMSVLRISANFRDELAWVRYLQLWERIGDVTSARIILSLSKCTTLKECINEIKGMNLQEEIYKTLELLDGLQYNPSKAIHETVKAMCPRLSVLYKDNNWTSRKKDFVLLEDMAQDKENISAFIAEYVLDPKLEVYNKNAGKNDNIVTLSTIHSAKGLEASNCYIVNVSPFSYPTPRAVLNGIDAIEEERRCLYVALTRAKDKLFIYKNVEVTSAVGLGINDKDYDGEILEEDIFIHKKFKTKIRVKRIENTCDSSVIRFNLVDNNDLQSITEWAFRKSYMPEKRYNSINANLSYFLNDIPFDIVNSEYITSNKSFSKSEHKSDTPFTDWDNFNFD